MSAESVSPQAIKVVVVLVLFLLFLWPCSSQHREQLLKLAESQARDLALKFMVLR